MRPGLIVGPGDPTDRFTYWPVRVERGGEVLAPGSAADPTQFIDVRDLAVFLLHRSSSDTYGTFNADAPGRAIDDGRAARHLPARRGHDAKVTWVPAAFLEKQNVAPWQDMPVWIPPEGDEAGLRPREQREGAGRGLAYRPLEKTVGRHAGVLARCRPSAARRRRRA